MTAVLRGRLAGLIRRSQPEPAAPAEGERAACRKCHLDIEVYDGVWTCIDSDPCLRGETNCGADPSAPYTPHEPAAGYDGSYDHPGWEDDGRSAAELIGAIRSGFADTPVRPGHPPWMTAPQPALAGPGSLNAFHAAEHLRGQSGRLDSEPHPLYGWDPPLAVPAGLARQPAPEPEPVPVSYPPLSFPADLRDLPHFKKTVRSRGWCGLATSFLPPALPYFPPGWIDAGLAALLDEAAA